jgi:hypothetical protein
VIRPRPTDGEPIKMMWYAPTDWVNYSDTIMYDEDLTNIHKYLLLLYNAVLFLGLNEIGPVNEAEMGYISVILLLSVILNVFIIGDIVSIANSLGSADSRYQI